MTSMIYLASDAPLDERRDPYEQIEILTINELLASGRRPPSFMLEDGFDRDTPYEFLSVLPAADESERFAIYPKEKPLEIISTKRYWATLGGTLASETIIDYLRTQLQKTDAIEIWHVWLDSEVHYRVHHRQIAIDKLTRQDLQTLEHTHVWDDPPESEASWEEPLINYCYRIVR